MLFNSILFCLVFLPIVLAGFLLLKKLKASKLAVYWLIMMSFAFYTWWYPPNSILLILSIITNYLIGKNLQRPSRSKSLLLVGVIFNLLIIIFFKYGAFLMHSVGMLNMWHSWEINIALPLAISFYTFQQITYLVDSYKGKIKESIFSNYILYVTFFPQLIAGPIVHHSDVMGQFKNLTARYDIKMSCCGFILFVLGLCKKVIFADAMAEISEPIFDGAHAGFLITSANAWSAAIGYTLQLYYDFSGYSDMAIGVGMMFNIVLPKNFNSPYKARSIIDFWRRWHITLSNFLRDYLYIPLGGNRLGSFKRYRNLIITMLLGGLWHGAGWSFIVWGGWHGFLLCINQFFGQWLVNGNEVIKKASRFLAWPLTLLVVIVGWVFFKAEDFGVGLSMVKAMFLLSYDVESLGYSFYDDYNIWGIFTMKGLLLLIGSAVALFSWNSSQLLDWISQKGKKAVAFSCGVSVVLLFLGLLINLSRAGDSEFIYFNF